ncbi:MAG: (Fe-S)-binding protein [Chloroflexi bacterium]|nr:(Fe-S)-binding protein [Chloroflexota bacterium]
MVNPPKLEQYQYDMERCIHCGGCRWVDHIYTPGVRFGVKCPSIARFEFDEYAAYGREEIGLALLKGELDYSPRFIDAVFQCQLCGACDAGCKRNLDLEPLLTLETLRARCVADGQGPLPAHKKVADNIAKTHNRYGSPHKNRPQWLADDIKPAAKADMLYFVGCASSYTATSLAQATARILQASGAEFMLLGGEECCGYPLYATGQVDAFIKQMERNLEALKKSGASTVIVNCAECYKTWRVDYPKVLGKSTADMGFTVMHIVEYVDQQLKDGKIKFKNPVEMKLTYHDSCNLGRLSEPSIYWEGTRGKYGCLEPSKEYRRGTYGIYQPPRDILAAIPGVELVEMYRHHENTWCCGAGGGVRDANKDFALWTAQDRLEEAQDVGAEAIVSACPYCKENFSEAIKNGKEKLKAYDIVELIAQAMKVRGGKR